MQKRGVKVDFNNDRQFWEQRDEAQADVAFEKQTGEIIPSKVGVYSDEEDSSVQYLRPPPGVENGPEVVYMKKITEARPANAPHPVNKANQTNTWAEVCSQQIRIPVDPRQPCVLNEESTASYNAPSKSEVLHGSPKKDVELLPVANDVATYTIVKRYKPIRAAEEGETIKHALSKSDSLAPWTSVRQYFRGLTKNWHRSSRTDPVGPTMYQNPVTGSFIEVDIDGHLDIHCPIEKKLFDDKFVVKVLLPGGNLRKCYVKFQWDQMSINFYRHHITRYYPFKYIQEANDSPGILTHMTLTGATSDLVQIDKRSFCSLYLSNVSHPLLLVFGNAQRKEFFVSLVQHIIEFCKSQNYFYYTPVQLGKKKPILKQRRNANPNIPILEIFKNELDQLDSRAIEERFEAGVKCAIITGKQYSRNCILKFDPSIAKLLICHSTGRSQHFPLQYVRSLEVEEMGLRAIKDAEEIDAAESFFKQSSQIGDNASVAPKGFYRNQTLAGEKSRAPVKQLSRGVSGVPSFTRPPSGGVNENNSSMLKRGVSVAGDGNLMHLTSEVLDTISDSKTFVAVGIQGCNFPLVIFFDNKVDRDDFVALVQVLQVIFNFKVAETDKELRLRQQQEQFAADEEEEVDGELEMAGADLEDIDEPTKFRSEDRERRIAGEAGLKFRYFRQGGAAGAGGPVPPADGKPAEQATPPRPAERPTVSKKQTK